MTADELITIVTTIANNPAARLVFTGQQPEHGELILRVELDDAVAYLVASN